MARLDALPTPESGDEPSVRQVTRTYDRIAPVYDLLDAFYEWSWKRKLRAELFSRARGRLLDVGVGTGCNMRFYPTGAEAVGIDTSRAMLARAREHARDIGVRVALYEMNLLALDFPDASFDTVTVTFVLLCLPDELQAAALKELGRVTRPDGRILVLDYHLSRRKHVRAWMRAMSGWLKWAFAARYDPQTERYVAEAGLEIAERRSFMGDGAVMLVLKTRAATAG
jgi:ubiquinone/menaquinone biosynthesis C-methylase UbiE